MTFLHAAQLRLEYPGAIYHVMSRANGKGNIETDVDRQDFVKTLAEICEKTTLNRMMQLGEDNLNSGWKGKGGAPKRLTGSRGE
jgi:hypothetical protein